MFFLTIRKRKLALLLLIQRPLLARGYVSWECAIHIIDLKTMLSVTDIAMFDRYYYCVNKFHSFTINQLLLLLKQIIIKKTPMFVLRRRHSQVKKDITQKQSASYFAHRSGGRHILMDFESFLGKFSSPGKR